MSPGIKAALANHMHGALAGLSAITVGADLLTVQTYRVDDVTARVQVNRRPPARPLVLRELYAVLKGRFEGAEA